MSNINFHNSPFGESTQVKLLLFEDYIIEWLPVFLSAKVKYYKTINVFDFFCGPGKDSNGIHGSPAIILKSLRRYYRYLNNPEITINVFLNDENSDKVKALKQMINKEQLDNGLGINIYYSSLDFKDAFDKYYQLMNQRSSANLILLDQCGVSLVDFERLSLIMNLKTTDFIMFIASSSIRRFAQTEEIKKFSISQGFLPTHAKQVVQIMINEKLIPKQKIRISENAFSKQAVDFLSLKDDSI